MSGLALGAGVGRFVRVFPIRVPPLVTIPRCIALCNTSRYRWLLTPSLLRFTDARVLRVAAPTRPAGQRLVAGVDADQLAVLRTHIDPAALNRRLETRRALRLPRFYH